MVNSSGRRFHASGTPGSTVQNITRRAWSPPMAKLSLRTISRSLDSSMSAFVPSLRTDTEPVARAANASDRITPTQLSKTTMGAVVLRKIDPRIFLISSSSSRGSGPWTDAPAAHRADQQGQLGLPGSLVVRVDHDQRDAPRRSRADHPTNGRRDQCGKVVRPVVITDEPESAQQGKQLPARAHGIVLRRFVGHRRVGHAGRWQVDQPSRRSIPVSSGSNRRPAWSARARIQPPCGPRPGRAENPARR